MNPLNRYHHAHQVQQEYQDRLVNELTGETELDYMRSRIRSGDMVLDAFWCTLKILTLPIWWPISRLKKRGKKPASPSDPYTTDLNRPLFK